MNSKTPTHIAAMLRPMVAPTDRTRGGPTVAE